MAVRGSLQPSGLWTSSKVLSPTSCTTTHRLLTDHMAAQTTSLSVSTVRRRTRDQVSTGQERDPVGPPFPPEFIHVCSLSRASADPLSCKCRIERSALRLLVQGRGLQTKQDDFIALAVKDGGAFSGEVTWPVLYGLKQTGDPSSRGGARSSPLQRGALTLWV
ncbi:unnamed protein product [Merluccius merluccius]